MIWSIQKLKNKIQSNPNFKTTHPLLVLKELGEFCNFFNGIKTREKVLENIGAIHNHIQRIHPFADGNSRTTRLIINWLLIKFEFPMLILKVGSFEKYMNLTKLAQKRCDEELRDFICNIILNNYLSKN